MLWTDTSSIWLSALKAYALWMQETDFTSYKLTSFLYYNTFPLYFFIKKVEYLKKERNLTPQLVENKLTELRNEYNWWQKGFNLEQRKEWIDAGFGSSDLEQVKNWKERNFSVYQTKQWINAGTKTNDYDFIVWLLIFF